MFPLGVDSPELRETLGWVMFEYLRISRRAGADHLRLRASSRTRHPRRHPTSLRAGPRRLPRYPPLMSRTRFENGLAIRGGCKLWDREGTAG